MEAVTVKFKMDPACADLKPAKAHPDDAAYDLRASEDVTLTPGKPVLVPTGLYLELPVGYEAQVRPRSGLAVKAGLTVLNSPGTIDAGYRGEIKCIMYNTAETAYEVKRGDRIAQMVITRLPEIILEETDELSDSLRSAGGFGSTGKN